MTSIWWIAACGILLNIAIGLGLTTSRRAAADVLLVVILFGTAGVALFLILGQALDRERAVDVALVIALLAAVLGVAAERLGWFDGSGAGDPRR
jgi:multicomponent Na+:H+ antiporter subunit F